MYTTVTKNQSSASGFAARQLDQVNIRSAEILDAWCQNIPPVPGIDDLARVVQAPLPRALPSIHPVPMTDRPIDDVISSCSALEDSVLIPELGFIRDAVHSLQKYGENEDSVHILIDNLVLRIMSTIGNNARCSFRVNRNRADYSGTTVSNLLPDVLVWLPSGVLAFKGEDKATPGEIQAARDELGTKLSCFSDAYFGGVPYLICYACGGYMLEFWVINRAGRKLISISPQVDLSTIGGRSLCVRYAVNISRVLLSLQKTYPERTMIQLGDRIKTQYSEVNILGFFVVKKTCHFTNDVVLKELYGQIQTMQVPSLISIEKWKFSRGVLTLQTSPVGFCGKSPGNVAELKTAGRQVLSALRWLHEHGWVHRDIRPANMMFADGRWYLMDLEWANRVDLDLENYNPNGYFLPPELDVFESGRSWTKACDMWQFGKVVEQWNQLDNDGHRYVQTQTHDDPAKRLSAEESLGHDFFR